MLTLCFAFGAPTQAICQTAFDPPPAPKGRKLALVIGNQDYANITKLVTAAADAKAMAKKLKEKGYAIEKPFLDLTRFEIFQAIEGFIKSIQENDEAVIYYAGHGVELSGTNFLLPVDIGAELPDTVKEIGREAFSLSDMMELLQRKQARAVIVIIDACRNNPLRPQLAALVRGVPSASAQGLASVTAAQGSYVMYSAGIGEQALDRLSQNDKDPNGLYTRNLLKLMDREGLEIDDLNEELVQTVRTAALSLKDKDGNPAPHNQRPATYDSLSGKFYFTPPKPAVTSCEMLAKPDASPEVVKNASLGGALGACERAVSDFSLDRRMVELLQITQEQLAFQKAASAKSVGDAQGYLVSYPTGRFKREVEAHIASLAPVTVLQPQPAPVVPQPIAPSPVVPPPAPVLTQPIVPPPAPAQVASLTPSETSVPNDPPVIPDAGPAEPPEVKPVAPAAADGPGSVTFARAAQTELRRLGCFASKPDGRWGAASRRAVDSYNRTTSSSLKADPAQWTGDDLAALRAKTGQLCRQSCPAGEKLTAAGACAPVQVDAPRIRTKPATQRAERAPARGANKPGCTWIEFEGRRLCQNSN